MTVMVTDDDPDRDEAPPIDPRGRLIGHAGVAELAGCAKTTPPIWLSRARRNPDAPGAMPLPDIDVAHSPMWYSRTIIEWLKNSDRWGKDKMKPGRRKTKRPAAPDVDEG
jgi:hypothetical protein